MPRRSCAVTRGSENQKGMTPAINAEVMPGTLTQHGVFRDTIRSRPAWTHLTVSWSTSVPGRCASAMRSCDAQVPSDVRRTSALAVVRWNRQSLRTLAEPARPRRPMPAARAQRIRRQQLTLPTTKQQPEPERIESAYDSLSRKLNRAQRADQPCLRVSQYWCDEIHSLTNRPSGKTLRLPLCSAGESGRFRQILRMALVVHRCWPVLAGVRTESEKHSGQNKRNSSC